MAAGVENMRGINRHLPTRCLKQKHISDRHWATFALLAFLVIVRLSVAEYHRSMIIAEFPSDEPMVIQTLDSDAAAGKSVSRSAGRLAVVEANSLPTLGASVRVIQIEGKTLGQPGYPL
jgi:hypothetical protein